MKMHTLILAFGGVVAAASLAQAQTAPAQPDALTSLQNQFGAVVGEAFHRPDPLVRAVATPGSPAVAIGKGIQTSMAIPGAVFAGALKPFADLDAAATPAPVAAAPVAPPPRRRHVRVRRHRTSGQG